MCLAISLDVSSNECVTIAHTLIKPCNDAVSLKQSVVVLENIGRSCSTATLSTIHTQVPP